jgi:hypothetical protein
MIDYIVRNIDGEEAQFCFSKMCIHRTSFRIEGGSLYSQIDRLMEDFIYDNELDDDWYDANIIDVDSVFEDVLKRYD